jgi:hypothetical protein
VRLFAAPRTGTAGRRGEGGRERRRTDIRETSSARSYSRKGVVEATLFPGNRNDPRLPDGFQRCRRRGIAMVRKLFLVLCVIVVPGIAWADGPANIPDVHVGDLWKYRIIDGYTKETSVEYSHRVVRLTDNEIVVQLQNKGSSGSKLVYYTREWNGLDSGGVRWEPFNPENKFPLTVGQRWNQDFKWFDSHGTSYSSLSRLNVAAFEKVVVPAGTFDAYKTVQEIETRKNGADADLITGRVITWYAPAVKKYVREEMITFSNGRERNKTVYELMEYSLQKESAPQAN